MAGDAWNMTARRIDRVLLVAAAALLVAGTAVAGRAVTTADSTHAADATDLPRLAPVPLISQAHPWSCGAAALMAVLVYYGVFDEAESRLDTELGVTPDQGTGVTRIAEEARRFGLEAEARTGLAIDDLRRELARGALIIAAVQAWPTETVTDWRARWDDGHYVVVVGVSDDRVYVMDPSVRTGYAYLGRDEWLARWHDYDQDGQRRVVWDRLGIVVRGARPLLRYPAEPTPIQ
ncbi:MAG TPA: cysteine peptidase family C39 domain-containing protein [Polyangia bacterium]|jgi:predicted double-glycine peptidase